MRRLTAWISGCALVATGTVAACNKPAQASDLSRDLDAAASPSPLTLAPTSGRRDVISAVEQSPEARRAPKPSSPQPRPVARHTPERTPVVAPPPATPAPATSEVATTPEPQVSAPAPSPRPVPVQQAPRGGYKTEAEVIRNAPFPILP
jgi:hypothetical protein